jgi:hypothetical protein
MYSASMGHGNSTNGLEKRDIPIYFSEEIIPKDRFSQTTTYSNDRLAVTFCRMGNTYISVPFAPWGSFYRQSKSEYSDLEALLNQIIRSAKSQHISTLTIKHPPSIYTHGIPVSWLKQFGFELRQEDVNQHLSFHENPNLHDMEKRKLSKLQGFAIHKPVDFNKYFNNLLKWRKAQEIPVNISYEHLSNLFLKFPDRYEIWSIENQTDTMAICFVIRVTAKHVYYFLPATNPKYRSVSPMVLLIKKLSEHYKQKGFEYFDLGQSSINGTLQEGLFDFKKRMGALTTIKPTLSLDL